MTTVLVLLGTEPESLFTPLQRFFQNVWLEVRNFLEIHVEYDYNCPLTREITYHVSGQKRNNISKKSTACLFKPHRNVFLFDHSIKPLCKSHHSHVTILRCLSSLLMYHSFISYYHSYENTLKHCEKIIFIIFNLIATQYLYFLSLFCFSS